MKSSARVQLFTELAETFRGMVKFPEDLIVLISDEQFVRNCVDTFYRTIAKSV